MDLAQVIERAQTAETRVLEDRQKNAKKRGEDAVLREKVRRDYRTLMQNLSQLTSDERKLKASQVEHYPVIRRVFLIFPILYFSLITTLLLRRETHTRKGNGEKF